MRPHSALDGQKQNTILTAGTSCALDRREPIAWGMNRQIKSPTHKCQAYLSGSQWYGYTEGNVFCNIRCLKWQ